MKRLFDALSNCKKEEEVKGVFLSFFKEKLNAPGRIDHYTEQILFEFKYDKTFKGNDLSMAQVIAQTMYYARALKFSNALEYRLKPLPPYICIVSKSEAFFIKTIDCRKYYTSSAKKYDWDRAASSPCPNLVADIEKGGLLGKVYVYDLSIEAEERQFIQKYYAYKIRQLDFLSLIDKKSITENNFLEVFLYWDKLFGKYVQNSHKSSEYFLADIEDKSTVKLDAGKYGFNIDGAIIPKSLQENSYANFWDNYEKLSAEEIRRLRQKSDRLSEDWSRRFNGEFYTPIEFAEKGLDYLSRTIGDKWWEKGEYRFWDMAAGTGNLEFNLPAAALPYCYISTLEEDDANYCQRIFGSSGATVFQYDYLNDDIDALAGNLQFGKPKMPQRLVNDLKNPDIKWIVFINPPFVTSNNADKGTGKKSKTGVSMTATRAMMQQDNLGETSRELFTQFLYRITHEFANRQTLLCLYSKIKYINSNNDQRMRDTFFQAEFKRGFIFPSKCFHGAKGDFPIAFMIWDIFQKKALQGQNINVDVYNHNSEKIGRKQIEAVARQKMLNKWVPRIKNTSIMPPLKSALNFSTENKDVRNRVAPGFLCSLCSKGDDMQNQSNWCLLSAPYTSAGAFSVTPQNFEKAMVLFAVKEIPEQTWTNDRDAFYAPSKPLPDEFVTDCVIYSLCCGANYACSYNNVEYQGRNYRIFNNLFPFAISEIKSWDIQIDTLKAQLELKNEDRFAAKWLQGKVLSAEATSVLDALGEVYKFFYRNIRSTPWLDAKIENYDAGLYQVRKALRDGKIGEDQMNDLNQAMLQLREKLLPQIYQLGFMVPDVKCFESI